MKCEDAIASPISQPPLPPLEILSIKSGAGEREGAKCAKLHTSRVSLGISPGRTRRPPWSPWESPPLGVLDEESELIVFIY